MKLGQTSAVHFLANVGTSILGFLATIYLTRNVPEEVLASYFLTVAVLIWVNVTLGRTVQKAVGKRLSESDQPDSGYVGAGLLIQAAIVGPLVVSFLLFRGWVNRYLRAEAAIPLAGLVLVTFAFSFVREILKGQHDVHVAALLQPFERGLRSIAQVSAVALGAGLSGLLIGYGVAALLASIVAFPYLAVHVYNPTLDHVRSLLSYIRYSWLGMLGGRAFASMDTLILGLFVATGSLITYYEIAWNVASLLAIFGVAVSETLFPEISQLGVEKEEKRIRSLMEDALAYAGLFLIPGLVGGALIGDRVLRVYGSGYDQASTVLVVLVLARVLYAYQGQFLNALNGVDRPDLAFRVNAVFVAVNVSGNIALVYLYGWIGAAVATATSSLLTLILAYRYFDGLIGITVPVIEIGRQVGAAALMGGGVLLLEPAVPRGILGTILLVGVGSGFYFLAILALSKRFRRTVVRNLPT